MTEQRKESILYQLRDDRLSISEICFGHGFESLSNFSNFCKKYFGDSPRNLRKEKKCRDTEDIAIKNDPAKTGTLKYQVKLTVISLSASQQ